MDSDGTKRATRSALLARRRALPPELVATASRAIELRLRSLAPLDDGVERTVLLYAADPDEVELDGLIMGPPAGWTVLLPRVVDGDIIAVPHRPDQDLIVGHRGIREPLGEGVDPSGIDVAVVPGVAFSPTGQRLGRGAGMYDRLLPRIPGALRIGVCMEDFVLDVLPSEAHDAPVDIIVTDASVRRSTADGPTLSA